MDYNRQKNRFSNLKIIEGGFPAAKLSFPDKFSMYYNHLSSLGLIDWPVEKQIPIKENNIQTGVTRNSRLTMTDFGKLFAKACIPQNGFIILK